MRRRWTSRSFDPAVAERIQESLGIPSVLAILLAQRGVVGPDEAAAFLEPSIDQLHDPFRMEGMARAVERIRQALAGNEKILVYGDYDVDGTTATVLLLKTLELLGGQADFHVPHRVREGYGMRADVIERAAADGVKVLISVDTGIRETEAVARAAALGIDAIVTDHHLPDAELPPAYAVLNPNQPGCGYPDKNLCGAGIAYKLACALLARSEMSADKVRRIAESMLKIVAIGTIADLVPLVGENRVFARLGLEGLCEPRNPGLEAILEVSDLLGKPAVSAGDIGFRVGPRLNAAGRMDTARDVVELFRTADRARAQELASKLDKLNAERQAAETAVVEEIVAGLGRLPPSDVLPFLVLAGEGWPPGVVGICASRIVERFHRPTLVLSIDPETGLATGSARSVPAFRLIDSLQAMAPIFERFGGHAQAAGCTLRAERIAELRDGLNEYAINTLGPDDLTPTMTVDAALDLGEIGDEFMGAVAGLAPHGMGNPAPVFVTTGARLAGEPRVLKEKHLKLRLEQAGTAIWAMGWRMAEAADELRFGAPLDVAYSVEADDYWGGWRLNLRDVRVGEARAAAV